MTISEVIIHDFARAWETLNPELIIKHLAPSFRYDSQWVFESLDYGGYVDYISGKFQSIKRTGNVVDVKICDDRQMGGQMIALSQNGQVCFYRIKIEHGQVVKGDLCMF